MQHSPPGNGTPGNAVQGRFGEVPDGGPAMAGRLHILRIHIRNKELKTVS